MPEIGADALEGTKETIKGYHTFTVTNQQIVKANGMMVQLVPAGKSQAQKTAKSTGDAGWGVREGDKVIVFNVDVVFD